MENLELIINLVSDESFQKYVGGTDSVSTKKWNAWLKTHPENFLELQKSEKIVLMLLNNPVKHEFLNKKEELQKILTKIKTEEQNSTPVIHMNMRSFWLRIAAIFIVAFLLGGFLFSIFSSKEISAPQNFTTINGKPDNTTIELPDGSKVWLKSGSTFRYPAAFSDSLRKVFLQGEAYFDVKKDSSRKFVVNAGKINITVLGTAFNIKCYENDETIETILVRGSVKINDATSNKELVKLKPNEKAIYQKSNAQLSLVKNIDTENVNSNTNTKKETLEFTNESLDKIAIRLERKFGKKMLIRDVNLRKNIYTGKFVNNESLETILNIISKASPFKYKIMEKQILIDKK